MPDADGFVHAVVQQVYWHAYYVRGTAGSWAHSRGQDGQSLTSGRSFLLGGEG